MSRCRQSQQQAMPQLYLQIKYYSAQVLSTLVSSSATIFTAKQVLASSTQSKEESYCFCQSLTAISCTTTLINSKSHLIELPHDASRAIHQRPVRHATILLKCDANSVYQTDNAVVSRGVSINVTEGCQMSRLMFVQVGKRRMEVSAIDESNCSFFSHIASTPAVSFHSQPKCFARHTHYELHK